MEPYPTKKILHSQVNNYFLAVLTIAMWNSSGNVLHALRKGLTLSVRPGGGEERVP